MDYSYKEMAKDLLFSFTAFEIPPFTLRKAPMRHKRWDRRTERPYTELSGEKKHKGPIGCVSGTGAPYTCK